MDSKCIRELLGNNVRQLREALGYSQEVLAKLTGLNRSYIGSIERCEHNVGIDNIDKIARGLNAPVSRLFLDARETGKTAKNTVARTKPHETRTTVVRAGQFKTLLEQCYQHTPRPDLVMIYLERCGAKFID